jgi:hypothetical protein
MGFDAFAVLIFAQQMKMVATTYIPVIITMAQSAVMFLTPFSTFQQH